MLFVPQGRNRKSRLEAGAPSAIEATPTRYALPTSRLEAGAPSVPHRRREELTFSGSR